MNQRSSQHLRSRSQINTWALIGVSGIALLVAALFFFQPQMTSSVAGVPGITGPGGVGEAPINNFWFDIASLQENDGAKIGTLSDRSGNSVQASINGNRRPVFRSVGGAAVNGRPVLEFDGSNDILELSTSSKINNGGPYEEKTLILAFRTGSDVTTQQFIYEQGGTIRGLNFFIESGRLYVGAYNVVNDDSDSPWGFYSVDGAVSPNTAYLAMLTLDYNNDEFKGYLDGTLLGTVNNVGRLHNHGNEPGIGAIHSENHDNSSSIANDGGRPFGGDLLELISYDGLPNTAQRRILMNYLAAKFGITITDDVFDQEATHSYEVAGIWHEATDGSMHDDAQGTAELRIYNPSSLDAGDGIVWGHSGEAMSQGNSTDVDGIQILSRIERSWRATVSGDPGTVDIDLDVSGLSGMDPTAMRLIIDRDGDDFQTLEETPISGSYDASTQVLTFTGVTLQDGDWFTVGATDNTFPVEWLDLAAEATPSGQVAIRWATAQELNNDFFTVERSTDGRMFTSVTDVAGAGTTTAPTHYEAMDAEPVAGAAYYRIRQTDFDGQFSYSPMVEINLSATNQIQLSLAPNPVAAGQSVQVRIDHPGGQAALRVLSLTGQELYRQAVDLSGGMQQVALPLANLAPGTYLVQVQSGQGQAATQLVIR